MWRHNSVHSGRAGRGRETIMAYAPRETDVGVARGDDFLQGAECWHPSTAECSWKRHYNPTVWFVRWGN